MPPSILSVVLQVNLDGFGAGAGLGGPGLGGAGAGFDGIFIQQSCRLQVSGPPGHIPFKFGL